MFKLADINDKEKIKSFCGDSLLGAYILCRMETYGFDYDFIKYWISETDGGISCVVNSFDCSVTVLSNKSVDCVELEAFIKMMGFKSITADEYISKKCRFGDLIYKQSFEYKGEHKDFFAQDDIDLKQAYSLISRAIPNSFSDTKEAFMSFLSDFTFRRNRNRARIKGLTDSDGVVSCAMTSAETLTCAIISGVACDENKRGGGFGKRTVLSLADELKDEGKKVYVVALNESAEKFYEKIGFVPKEKIAYFN